ncbi:DUF3303 family protein [Aminomonas paucivorans]|uniref:DUF3303 family protein n=1 Tax=Aminomonas paucivorans TaxID=81412 RepID=UPI00331BED36
MLFLVVSSPAPDLNEEVQRKRREFRGWIRELEAQGKVRHYYPRIARGSVVVFDVASNEELHGLLSQWLGFVEVRFDLYPLVAPEEAERFLE